MKRSIIYALIGLGVIAVVFGAWRIISHNRDLTETSPAAASSTPIVTPMLTITPSITVTSTLTATMRPPTQTATSTLTKTATKRPTFTITPSRTPQPPQPTIVKETSTPEPTGRGGSTPVNGGPTQQDTPGG